MSEYSNHIASALVLGHHDADGLVSAALLAAYIRRQHPDAEIVTGAVDFHLASQWPHFWRHLRLGKYPEWQSPRFVHDAFALADFPATFVPDNVRLYYADHHITAFLSCGATERLRALYENHARRGGFVVHDPNEGSCALLLLKTLERAGWSPPNHLSHAAAVADQIDRAAYPDIESAINHRTSLLAAISALALSFSEREAAGIIRALALDAATLEEAFFHLHSRRVQQILAELDESLEKAGGTLQELNDATVVIDWSSPALLNLRVVRFLEFLHAPDKLYSVRIQASRTRTQWVIRATVARSPWIPSPPPGFAHPDCRKLVEPIGGGGHPYAAGFHIAHPSLEAGRRQVWDFLRSIAALLAPLPIDHSMAATG